MKDPLRSWLLELSTRSLMRVDLALRQCVLWTFFQASSSVKNQEESRTTLILLRSNFRRQEILIEISSYRRSNKLIVAFVMIRFFRKVLSEWERRIIYYVRTWDIISVKRFVSEKNWRVTQRRFLSVRHSLESYLWTSDLLVVIWKGNDTLTTAAEDLEILSRPSWYIQFVYPCRFLHTKVFWNVFCRSEGLNSSWVLLLFYVSEEVSVIIRSIRPEYII